MNNRKIKFQAWDREHKKMVYEIPLATVNFYGSLNEFFKETALMQYTGLHDKNGTEIYEGDIIQIATTYNGWRAEVKWDNRYMTGEAELRRFDKNCIEIIGNIYENKELLK